MIALLETLARGLGNGATYALLAVSFVIIYKATRVISFAQPGFMLAGAIIISLASRRIGFFPAIALAVVAVALLALCAERTVVRPMLGKPVFVIVVITLGLDIVIRVFVNILIGSRVRQVGDPWGLDAAMVGGLRIQQRHIAMVVATIIIVAALFAFFRYTRMGLAMRATAYDQEAALTQGVPVGSVFALSWALAGAIAAVAGAFVATGSGFDQSTWVVALKAIPAIIIGGLESIEGAVVGGFAVGIVEAVVGVYQPSLAPWFGPNFAVVSPYLLMLVVLLMRPYGLFGTREVSRV